MWAVVTGAGSGIGAALTRKLLQAGVNVVAVGRRQALLDELNHSVLVLRQSWIDPAARAAVLHTVSADVGCGVGRQAIAAALPMDAPLNFLVNNAGVGMPDKIQDIALYDFEQALATNVTGPLFLTQMLLPRLRQCDGKARVLNIGSGIADRVQSGTELASVDVSEDSAQGIRACDGVDRRVWVAYARPGVVDTPGLRDHIQLAASKSLTHADWLAESVASLESQKPTCLDAEVVGNYLAKLLLQGTAPEFSAKEWVINVETLACSRGDPWRA